MCYLEDSMSRGERMAEFIFQKHNVDFVPQKRFDGCRDKHTLPFDFAKDSYMNNLRHSESLAVHCIS
jgi:hypothetical protein